MIRKANLFVFLACMLALLVIQVYYCLQWWGAVGGIAGLVLFPFLPLFPFVYWIMVGFPISQFGLAVVGLTSLLLAILQRSHEQTEKS